MSIRDRAWYCPSDANGNEDTEPTNSGKSGGLSFASATERSLINSTRPPLHFIFSRPPTSAADRRATMAWRYLDQPHAAYAPSLFDDYPQPAPHADASRPGPSEPPPGFAYQAILNSFALAELNVKARPYLAQITGWLPLELGPHSRVGGTGRGHWKDSERERERQMEWGVVRDPRFEWSEFPRTVGWEVRGRWRAEREEEARRRGGVDATDRDPGAFLLSGSCRLLTRHSESRR